MHKRQFERIARALVAFRRIDGASLTSAQYEALVDQLARACQDCTPAGTFNYTKFSDACDPRD